jgi:hypothetical protein
MNQEFHRKAAERFSGYSHGAQAQDRELFDRHIFALRARRGDR